MSHQTTCLCKFPGSFRSSWLNPTFYATISCCLLFSILFQPCRAGVEWLADLLTSNTNPKLTIIMVTHDRAFMEQVCDCILELDCGSLYEHQGSYSSYLQAKEERLANEDAAVQAAKSKYRVELEWMRRQPQARESKSKARIDAFYKLEKATKPRPRDPNLNLIETVGGKSRRIGSKVLTMKNVCLTFDDRIMLDDFTYDFCVGDRICLAGANGGAWDFPL